MKTIKIIIAILVCVFNPLTINAQQEQVQIKIYKDKSKTDNGKKKKNEKLYTQDNNTSEKQHFEFHFDSKNLDKDMAILQGKLKDLNIDLNIKRFNIDQEKLNRDMAALNKRLENLNIQPQVYMHNLQKSQYPTQTLFDRLNGHKNITSIYISKSMLDLASNMKINMGNANIKDISRKLDQIEIYTSENKDAAKLMQAESKTFSRNKAYELLMNIKDNEDIVTFYGVKVKETFKELIMITTESEECVIIRMVGNFTAEDIQKVSGKKIK